jgi:transposase
LSLVQSAPVVEPCKLVPGRIDIEAVAVDQIIGVALRQALAQTLPGLAAVAGARHGKRPIARHAQLVLDPGHKPGRARVLRVRRDREAEIIAG